MTSPSSKRHRRASAPPVGGWGRACGADECVLQGLAVYLEAQFGDAGKTAGVVLGYDHRARGAWARASVRVYVWPPRGTHGPHCRRCACAYLCVVILLLCVRCCGMLGGADGATVCCSSRHSQLGAVCALRGRGARRARVQGLPVRVHVCHAARGASARARARAQARASGG